MKNYADRGGCYPPKHNSSYHTKVEFNNCFFNLSKDFDGSENTKFIETGSRFDINCFAKQLKILPL